ncbi:MAG TPA: hypothetical protein V6C69_00570 [Trichormus sp.]|jgi:hypothetical protein
MKSEGIVYIIDGAGSSGFTPLVLKSCLAQLPYEVEQFHWSTGWLRVLSDLTNRDNMQAKSDQLLRTLCNYKNVNPDRPIFIIAKSAGTAIALNAVSQLGANSIERLILMSPAVSPGYSLDAALAAVRQEIVCFWSPVDILYLKYGTSWFGTADGVFGKAAGLIGFNVPEEAADLVGYQKLRQIKWEPSMLRYMHSGDHWGNSMPPFVNKFIVPLLSHDQRET